MKNVGISKENFTYQMVLGSNTDQNTIFLLFFSNIRTETIIEFNCWKIVTTDLEIFLIHICARNAEANKLVLFERLS